MIGFLVLMPLVASLLVMLVRRSVFSKMLLLLAAVAHFIVTGVLWTRAPAPLLNGWLALDAAGLPFLSAASLLFLAAAIYAQTYLKRREEPRAGRSDASFIAILLVFLSTMTLVTVCQQLELLWVAIEATTLASAPLIYFHKNSHSLEATWKYLIICSVGIALSLLGTFFVGVVSQGGHSSLIVSELVARVGSAQPNQVLWLRTAFIFLFVGYGTKMGLAPMHTWLPDAHSEAPSLVSALLSGALLNCAFLGILRGAQICIAAGQVVFVQQLFLAFGLLSMTFAAAFMVRQTDFKRLLAYSSVEHMGILAIGMGLGGTGVFGSLLHAVNHSLTKGMLFFAAGNLLEAYKSKSTSVVRGVFKHQPATGVLWVIGLFALSGSPPFGPFVSEFLILKTALDGGRYVVATLFVLLLGIAFIAMSDVVLRLMFGAPPQGGILPPREKFWTVAAPFGLAVLVLILGLYVPPILSTHLKDAARLFGG